jgi:hypothetical protein
VPPLASTVAKLSSELARVGVASAADLRSMLRVSPPTLSRLVARAGDEVCRMGRGRATRYARTRSIEGLGRRLPVFRIGEAGDATRLGTVHPLWGGRHWWELPDDGQLFEGLPPAFADMAPQGYLGHGFSSRFPELHLPPRITDWADDHRLVAIARRGEDCVGNLVVGDESLARFLGWSPHEASIDTYPALAERSATEPAGSSAGGERPKFGAFVEGRHVLVKFAPGEESAAARRWRDLLWCEWKALEMVAAAGVPAARARCVDVKGWRFLEAERFDRVGGRGRRAVLTLAAIDNEYFGKGDTWTAAAARLGVAPFSLPPSDAAHLRWLDAFGQLIANTDRHSGNVAFFAGTGGTLRLAPAYDMLPMNLAPSAETVVRRPFTPAPPSGDNLQEWRDSATWAQRYWREIQANPSLASDVRMIAGEALEAVGVLAARVSPGRVS